MIKTTELSILFKNYNHSEDSNSVLLKFLLSYSIQAYINNSDSKQNSTSSKIQNKLKLVNKLKATIQPRFLSQSDRIRELILLFPNSIFEMKFNGYNYLNFIRSKDTWVFNPFDILYNQNKHVLVEDYAKLLNYIVAIQYSSSSFCIFNIGYILLVNKSIELSISPSNSNIVLSSSLYHLETVQNKSKLYLIGIFLQITLFKLKFLINTNVGIFSL